MIIDWIIRFALIAALVFSQLAIYDQRLTIKAQELVIIAAHQCQRDEVVYE